MLTPEDPNQKNDEPKKWPEINEQPYAPYNLGVSEIPNNKDEVVEDKKPVKVFVDDDFDHFNNE